MQPLIEAKKELLSKAALHHRRPYSLIVTADDPDTLFSELPSSHIVYGSRKRFEKALMVQLNDYEHLPFQRESIDLVILHEVLEIADHPHTLLREVGRILRPDGMLLIIGIQPYSWHRLYLSASKWSFKRRYLSVQRILDWLSLLDYDPHCVGYGVYPPLEAKRPIAKHFREGMRLLFPALGGVYLVRAKKNWIPLRMQPLSLRERLRTVLPLAPPLVRPQTTTPVENSLKRNE